MKKGVVLTLKDGEKSWYDPVDFPDGLTENETHYSIDNGHFVYKVEKYAVSEVGWYEICQTCGWELDCDGKCRNVNCVKCNAKE